MNKWQFPKQLLLTITATSLLIGAISATAQNTYYRYTNKDGVKVMNSNMPPEYVQFGYEVVTIGGDVIEVVAPAPTAEELKNEAKQRQREAELAEWDEYLLKRYSSASEIESAKQRKVADFQGSMSILKGNANSIKNQIETVQGRAANIERSGRPVPASLLTNLKELESELKETERLVALRLEDQKKIEDKFDQDIARFNEIRPMEIDEPTEVSASALAPGLQSIPGKTTETANVTD